MGPVGLAIALLVPLGILANQKVAVAKIWTSEAVKWIGRALLAAWAVVAAIALINDLVASSEARSPSPDPPDPPPARPAPNYNQTVILD